MISVSITSFIAAEPHIDPTKSAMLLYLSMLAIPGLYPIPPNLVINEYT
jgi:hypothetical protein